jgi:regulator of sirC expression with transglutaminase-like and TPR domain
MTDAPFAAVAARAAPGLDDLALALAAEFRAVDADGARARLDDLAAQVPEGAAARPPAAQAAALAELLGAREGFAGARARYDHPDHSMLDLVLERRRGLPILLSVVYVEVARRAGIALAGVGLPGHYVVGHFGAQPPLLLDPFGGGAPVHGAPAHAVRPWSAHETALRMLNTLVGAFERRAHLGPAIRAAELRLELPVPEEHRDLLETELRGLRARLN